MPSNACAHFGDELDKLVHRFRFEYELSYAEAVGTLLMRAHLLMVEASKQEEEEADA